MNRRVPRTSLSSVPSDPTAGLQEPGAIRYGSLSFLQLVHMQQAINGSELGPWSTITGGARGPRRARASLADRGHALPGTATLRHPPHGSGEDHAAHAKVLLLQLQLQLLKVGSVSTGLAETHSRTSAWAAVVVTYTPP